MTWLWTKLGIVAFEDVEDDGSTLRFGSGWVWEDASPSWGCASSVALGVALGIGFAYLEVARGPMLAGVVAIVVVYGLIGLLLSHVRVGHVGRLTHDALVVDGPLGLAEHPRMIHALFRPRTYALDDLLGTKVTPRGIEMTVASRAGGTRQVRIVASERVKHALLLRLAQRPILQKKPTISAELQHLLTTLRP